MLPKPGVPPAGKVNMTILPGTTAPVWKLTEESWPLNGALTDWPMPILFEDW
jgi:hypothetical protein